MSAERETTASIPHFESDKSASTHSARMWLFKSAALVFIFGGLAYAFVCFVAGASPAGALAVSLLGAAVWLLADIADILFSRSKHPK